MLYQFLRDFVIVILYIYKPIIKTNILLDTISESIQDYFFILYYSF